MYRRESDSYVLYSVGAGLGRYSGGANSDVGGGELAIWTDSLGDILLTDVWVHNLTPADYPNRLLFTAEKAVEVYLDY